MPDSSSRWRFAEFDSSDESVVDRWNRLVADGGGSAVQRAEFVFSCAELLAPSGLRLARLGAVDNPRAMALIQPRTGLPDVFIESQMPLGAWIQSPGESITELARSLIGEFTGGLRLGISQLDPRFAPMPEGDATMSTLPYIETPWLEVSGRFADYWAARGKNLRGNMRKQREKLAAQGVHTRMEILQAASEMAQGVRDYAGLESRGWKAELGTAVSEEHPQFRFYRHMLERFAALGQARIYRYFFDDRLVATELCLLNEGEFVILKTTYDESTSPLSPASLLRQEMFAELFDGGQVRRVEFYGPLKDWHTRWTASSRTLYHLNAHRNALALSVVEGMRALRNRG